MSKYTVPGQAPDPTISRPDRHDSGSPSVSSDPLLQNGAFIDGSGGQASSNLNVDLKQTAPQPPSSLNGAETVTSPPPKSRRKVPVTMASRTDDSLNWLPPGWMVEDRVRSSGATAGTRDKYYIEPSTGRRFRSKKEVQYYLETGTRKRKKKGTENSEADANPQEIPRSHKGKKAAKAVKVPEITFDYINVPDRIEWALTNANEDIWTAFTGSERVPEFIKQNWEFEMLHSHC